MAPAHSTGSSKRLCWPNGRRAISRSRPIFSICSTRITTASVSNSLAPSVAVDTAHRRGSVRLSAGRRPADVRIAGDPRGRGNVAGRRLGIQHEQQHQELILTDLKYLLSCNPLSPVYRESGIKPSTSPRKKPAGNRFRGTLSRLVTVDESFPSTTNDRGTRFFFSRSN